MFSIRQSSCFISAALLIASAPSALADPQGSLTAVELPVESVLAPPKGYDDNDLVQVVVRGTLPNGCYVLGDSTAQLETGTTTIRVRQNAFKKNDGVCADEATLPDQLKFPVRYTSETSVGNLPVGDYHLTYTLPSGAQTIRHVNVSKAPVPATDSYPYANVTQVFVPSLQTTADEVTLNLSGILNSSCMEIDTVEVKRIDDVFVVLPILKFKAVTCTGLNVPFFRKVKIGKLAAGEFLMHVRGANGRGINQVVEVVDAP